MNEVNTGGTLTSIAVESSVGLDEVSDIGDVDTDVVCAILVERDRQSVVKILGSVGVDGENALLTEVLANLDFPFGNADTTFISMVRKEGRP